MGKLHALAEENQTTVHDLIDEALRKEGSIFRAALSLGVVPSAIHHYCQSRGYEVVVEKTARLVKRKNTKTTERAG